MLAEDLTTHQKKSVQIRPGEAHSTSVLGGPSEPASPSPSLERKPDSSVASRRGGRGAINQYDNTHDGDYFIRDQKSQRSMHHNRATAVNTSTDKAAFHVSLAVSVDWCAAFKPWRQIL